MNKSQTMNVLSRADIETQHALKQKPMTAQELADHFQISIKAAQRRVYHLVGNGVSVWTVKRDGGWKYEIKS